MKAVSGSRATWACALAPWGFLALLATTVLHLRLGLGRFPRPMIDDYVTPLFRLHSALTTWVGVEAFLGAPLVWLILLAFPRLRPADSVFVRQFVVFLAGGSVFFAFAIGDPRGLVDWYLD